MSATFKRAVRGTAKARIAIDGPAKAGKSMTALRIARGLVGPQGFLYAVDTESDALLKYADTHEFDHRPLKDHNPLRFIEALQKIEVDSGGDPAVAIIDSLSHSWMGTGGTLESVEAKKKTMKNDFMAWAEPSQDHRKLMEAILQSKVHVVCTLRSKMSYEIQEQNGKKVPVKIGLQPIHRDGVEYEFDVLASMDHENVMTVHGTRCRALKGLVVKEPDERMGEIVRAWLDPTQHAPEEMPQTFEVGGKRYHTAGVTETTLVALWAAKRKDPARIALELETCGLEVLEDLNEAQAKVMLERVAANG